MKEETKHYIYAIKSNKDSRIYVGLTQNYKQRLSDHNLGREFSTRAHRPWKLIYLEKVSTRTRARTREKYFKSGCGKEFLKNIIPG